jgi:hypothetical protein
VERFSSPGVLALSGGASFGIEVAVAAGDKYRARALELFTRAESAKDSETRAKLEGLATAFNRLAMQAEKNADLIVEFELPPDGKPKP